MKLLGQATRIRQMVCAFALGATVAIIPGCELGLGYAGDDYPPDAYIATTEPIYYEGHATYWYGDRWYYRDGRRWNHYDREPPGLYQHRIQTPPRRRAYEAPRGRPQGGPPDRREEHREEHHEGHDRGRSDDRH